MARREGVRREGAACLLGAAQALAERFGAPLRGYASLLAGYRHAVAAARAALGNEAFERAHAGGKGMSDAEATALALQGPAPDLSDPGHKGNGPGR